MSTPAGDTNVAIIGCGNIGSRLLQSLARVEGVPLSIDGFERSAQSREIALQRFFEARGDRRHTLCFPSKTGSRYDFGLVATDSRSRLEALRTLVRRKTPQRVVLEKFLFTRAKEYEDAAQLLSDNGIEAWVNCSRNEWPGYAALKLQLTSVRIRSFCVIGADWGLACNGIHFLALLEYLTDSKIAKMEWADGPPTVREAKRAGYLELTGSLTGRSESGTSFKLTSLAYGQGPSEVIIETESERYIIREATGTLLVENTEKSTKQRFEVLLASELAPVFERILTKGQSTLPMFREAAELHLKAMAVMNEGFHGSGGLDAECPVT